MIKPIKMIIVGKFINKICKGLTLIVIICSLSSGIVEAQKGLFVTAYGAGQISSIANNSDFYIKGLTFKYDLKSAYGVNVTLNLLDIFGFESGLRISNEGQKYIGQIVYDANTKDSALYNFTSRCDLKYFQIPLLLRFNTELEDDIVYMNISAGIQMDILSKATMSVSVPIPDSLFRGNDVSNHFKIYSTSFVANAGLNILLTKKLFLTMSLQMTKSFGDIENKSFAFDQQKMGFEYAFPVSIKKEAFPSDYTTRDKTKNVVYSLSLGISYRIY